VFLVTKIEKIKTQGALERIGGKIQSYESNSATAAIH
jgi:hypothetical protein